MFSSNIKNYLEERQDPQNMFNADMLKPLGLNPLGAEAIVQGVRHLPYKGPTWVRTLTA